MPALTIVIACDGTYLRKYGMACLASIATNAPECGVYLHIADPNDDSLALIDQFIERYPSLAIAVSHERIAGETMLPDEARIHYACLRFIRGFEFLRKTDTHVITLDADSLVMIDPTSLLGSTTDYDLALRQRPEQIEDHLRVAVGTVFFRRGKPTLRFFAEWVGDLCLGLATQPYWFIDQRLFYRRWRARTYAIRLADLPAPFCDWNLQPDAVIWTAKGAMKDEDSRYLEQVSLYNALAGLPQERLP